MNIQFNFQRFTALLKRDFSVHYRKLPLFAAGLGAFLLLILGINMANDHYTIKSKIGVRTDAQLVWFALSVGLVRLDDVSAALPFPIARGRTND